MMYFAVRRIPGPGWSPEVPLRSQPLWHEHAAFMEALAAEEFVVLGGLVGDGNDALLVINAPREAAVRSRLALDPWSRSETLLIKSVEPWTVLLDSRRSARPPA
jgi:hypothetical protein